MKILVDADSCPVSARIVILKAAARTGIGAVFAANRPIPDLGGGARMELCGEGPGAADDRLVELACAGDLAITRDIALAKRLIDRGAAVMDDRGRQFTKENVGEAFSIRCFRVALAESGAEIARTANYGKKELKAFAAGFDKILTALAKKGL
ncbi:MAG: DUF188 domain-containing protein [Spirochaetaceae bacterium]|jgi:uncharacterized protein YaiI (UPF0178 family)|nr:DUF188 domain-containing protein [Spirochaetaceae bacterium]